MSRHTDLPLIRTKLAPPRIGQRPVSRDTLLRSLSEREDRKTTLVLGPAGCGKTSLLVQWRQSLLLKGAKVAWFNAGPDDDRHVAAYIVEGLKLAGLEVDTEALHHFARSGGKASDHLLASLVNDLADQAGEFHLFIDDFHHISSYNVLQVIDRWINLFPSNFHLVLSSRLRPPLDLSRLRPEDQVTEVLFDDLRFGMDETRRFVDAQGLTALRDADVQALHEITDGWAAGMQLLAFSLRKQASPSAFLEQRRGGSLSQESALDDYLNKAILEHLGGEELDFLVRIAACRRFNRELCELLTANPRAAEFLSKLEHENLFLLPIETSDAEPWYRFHRLFAAFLEQRLHKLPTTEIRKLHQLASNWFAGKGLHIEAMRHATAAGDSELMLDLIDRSAHRMINSANFVEYISWCDRVPREALRGRIKVCLSLAWSQLACGRVADFEKTMADIVAHPGHAKAQTAVEIDLLRAFHSMREDDTHASLKIVEDIMRRGVPLNAFQSFLLSIIASLSLVYTGEFERARDVGRQWLSRTATDRPEAPKPMTDILGGFSHFREGNLRMAIPLLEAFIEDALRQPDFGGDRIGVFGGYLLEAYYVSGEITLARAFLNRHFHLIDAVGVADGLLYSYRARARLQLLDGDMAAARQTLVRLEEHGIRRGLDRVVAWSLWEQARLLLKEGERAPVPEILRRLDQLAERHAAQRRCALSEIPLAALLAHADAEFERSTDTACLAAIDSATERAKTSRRQILVVRLGLMRAMVLLRDGQAQAAITAARTLIAIALGFGVKRILFDIGRRAVPLIDALLASTSAEVEREFLQASRDSIAGVVAPGAVSPVPAGKSSRGAPLLAGSLSPREMEILELLGKGLSMKGIARGLAISPGTVKWHLQNLYGKLGSSSREDALAQARSRALIR